MSRPLTPYLFAGLLGAVSGIYIFGPLFADNFAARQTRGETTSKATERPQTVTTLQDGK